MFERGKGKPGLSAQAACAAVRATTIGRHVADFGGGWFKRRIVRSGQAKRGGFHKRVGTNKGSRWTFVFGCAKYGRGNSDKDRVGALKTCAAHWVWWTAQALTTAQHSGQRR